MKRGGYLIKDGGYEEGWVVNVRRTTHKMLTITLVEIDCLPVTR